MVSAWIEAGQPYELFWSLTFKEITTILQACETAAWSRYERAYFTAYYSGVFSQPYEKGKFPKYDNPADKRRKRNKGVQRNWRELKTVVETWNASAGGFDNRK